MGEYIERPEHDEFVKRMEEEHDRQNKRITLLEDSVRQFSSLTLSVERLAINMENMVEEQKKQGKRLETLEDVPKKNWDSLKFGVLGAIAGAIGYGIAETLISFM